jgi:protein TonB
MADGKWKSPLIQEADMTSWRMLVACGVVAAVAMCASASAVGQTPSSVGPLEKQAKPITPENPVPARVNYEAPFYPPEATAAGAAGRVTVSVTLDELGRVAEVRRTRLELTAKNPPVSLTVSGSTAEDDERFILRANQNAEQAHAVRNLVKALTDAAIQSVQQWRYDPPASAPISFPVTVSFTLSGEAGEAATARQSLSSGSTYAGSGQPVRVGGTIREPKNIKRVAPVYPPEAQAAGVSGLVILEVLIGGDGRVSDAKVLRSIPMLDQAAIDAVLQWEYTPTLLNGVPVPVVMTVTVNFTLG